MKLAVLVATVGLGAAQEYGVCSSGNICSGYQVQGTGLTLDACTTLVNQQCSYTAKFSYRPTGGFCYCSNNQCASEFPIADVDTYCEGAQPALPSQPADAYTYCDEGMCSGFEKHGNADTWQGCADRVRAECSFTGKFSYKPWNGACFCSNDMCATTIGVPDAEVYCEVQSGPTPPTTARPTPNPTAPPSSSSSPSGYSQCEPQTMCSGYERHGSADTWEECAEVVNNECAYTDKFSYRERNGACFCSTDECATYTTIPDVDTYCASDEENGFDFGSGCLAGDGDFAVELTQALAVEDLPGVIPAGRYGVRVNLDAGKDDIDIQLFDMQETNPYSEGAAIVAYCTSDVCNRGILGSAPGVERKTYMRPGMSSGLDIEYSGYNGVTSLGDEYIQIYGATSIPTKMRVFAYATGMAKVTYSWERSQSACCRGQERCPGQPFSQDMLKDGLATIGIIPVGKINVRIDLTAAEDVDIQLYDMNDNSVWSEGQAIIGYCSPPPGSNVCNRGTLHGPDRQELVLDGVNYVYSGYNGQDGQLGNEYIEIIGTTNRPLLMKAFGWAAGSAGVTYSWFEPVA